MAILQDKGEVWRVLLKWTAFKCHDLGQGAYDFSDSTLLFQSYELPDKRARGPVKVVSKLEGDFLQS